MLTKPPGREVVCHASAWDVGTTGDVRIKMCTQPTDEDLQTLHHELGHVYYFLAYKDRSRLYQDGANGGFHEAIGDAITLSMTPEYLHRLGLVDAVGVGDEATINFQMKMALDKVAFLPYGRLLDEWRWGVFNGKIAPANYQKAYWDLRRRYQGVASPVPVTEDDFDPGAKFHVPSNDQYVIYFLARILQFQFHRALCRAAGHTGPLHTCSIYGSQAAGKKFWDMLSMGASRPWPDALEALTGERQMDAGAMLEYFAPLQGWLKKQNAGQQCGW
jgi:peptidyl-dipeptidase A